MVSERVTALTGIPERPLDREGLRHKFMLLTNAQPEADMARLFERLQRLDDEPTLDWLSI